jgi:hypothetical protein
MRGFFESTLQQAAEEAAISLWLHAFETWYSEAERGGDDERFRGILGDD